jgi:hypothetical protein
MGGRVEGKGREGGRVEGLKHTKIKNKWHFKIKRT